MFYDLLDLQLNNNNYRLLQVNKSVKNKFLTNFLIGLDSKYLKLDEPDMNKTSNYYKDKLNDKIMLQYNKNFSKANTSHLDYLSDICRVNLVIYDMAKNKQKYANNNGSSKTLYMLKNGTAEYLLLKENKNFMRTLLPMSLAEKLSGLSLEGGVDPPEPSVSNTSNNNNSIINYNESVVSISNNENSKQPPPLSPLSTPPLPSPPLSPQSSGISQPQPISNKDETKLIKLITDYNYDSIIEDNFKNTIDKELELINQIEELMKKLNLEDEIKNKIRKYISIINTEIFLSLYFKSNNDDLIQNNQAGGVPPYNESTVNAFINNQSQSGIINKTEINNQNALTNLDAFVKDSKRGQSKYLRYLLENFLDTVHDFGGTVPKFKNIIEVMTYGHNYGNKFDASEVYQTFCDTEINMSGYVFDKAQTNKSKPERFFTKKVIQNILNRENYGDSVIGNRNRDAVIVESIMLNDIYNNDNKFNSILVVQNAEGSNYLQELVNDSIEDIKEEYENKYNIFIKSLKNPTSIIDSGTGNQLYPEDIKFLTQNNLCKLEKSGAFNMNDKFIAQDIPAIKQLVMFQDWYLWNVYDFSVGNVDLSDIYASYFKFITEYYNSKGWSHYNVKFHFRLAELVRGKINNQNKFENIKVKGEDQFKYQILCTIEYTSGKNTDHVSFFWNSVKGDVINSNEYIEKRVVNVDKLPTYAYVNRQFDYDTKKIQNFKNMKIINCSDNFNDWTVSTGRSPFGKNLDGNTYSFFQANKQPYNKNILIKPNAIGYDYLTIINSYIFGVENTEDDIIARKRLLYTFKLIGDQGIVRFAKLLKIHIQRHDKLKNLYNVLYIGGDYLAQLYGGLCGIESSSVGNNLFVGDKKFTLNNYNRARETLLERLLSPFFKKRRI